MTIFGISNLVPVAGRNPLGPFEQHQQQSASEQHKQVVGDSSKSVVEVGDRQLLPQDLISSVVKLTENDDEDTTNTDKDIDTSLNTNVTVVPSKNTTYSIDHEDSGHHGLDDDEEDSSWNLDGTNVSNTSGLLASGGLGSSSLSPFTSRAHAAAAFGRLAKRAITFGDLISAVDAFTAAYGQLEQSEQRIVIARMYFLNRQLLYCQHDIIRQKQALAFAALLEQQTKMIEAGHMMNPNMASTPGMAQPEQNVNPFPTHLFQNMDAGEEYGGDSMVPQQQQTPLSYHGNNAGGHEQQIHVQKVPTEQHPAANLDMMAPVIKPGIPLVQIQPKAKSPEPRPQPQQPSQSQPVRLDAKHLLLLQYLQNNGNSTTNNAANQTPFGNRTNRPTGVRRSPNNDVGIQVCLPSEPIQYGIRGKSETGPFTTSRGIRRSQPPPHLQRSGNRRTMPSWLPESEVAEDFYLPPDNTNNQSAALAALMMQHQPSGPHQQMGQRMRPPNNRRPNNVGNKGYMGNWAGNVNRFNGNQDFGFFDNELMRAAQQQVSHQQVNHLFEQLLLANAGMNPQDIGNKSAPCEFGSMCSCQNQCPVPNIPVVPVQRGQVAAPQMNPLSQQAAQLLSRPLRRFDNVDGDSDFPDGSKNQQQPISFA